MDVTVDGVNLHVIDEGEGPAVLLLHGFPDSSALWRHQIPRLVDAGFRVLAPDLRGFGASDRPSNVSAYRMEVLVGDVLGILDAHRVERADVVGHDWGSASAGRWPRSPRRGCARSPRFRSATRRATSPTACASGSCPGTCCGSSSPE